VSSSRSRAENVHSRAKGANGIDNIGDNDFKYTLKYDLGSRPVYEGIILESAATQVPPLLPLSAYAATTTLLPGEA